MKKQIFNLAIVAAMIGGFATGCSSEKKAGGSSDSTTVDSVSAITPAATDTAKKDTATRDTTKMTP